MTVDHTNAPLLRVENLGLRHVSGASSTPILSQVSFDLGRGEILGIIGESGAGKSTIGNAILDLLAPEFQQTSGTVSFGGKAMDSMTAEERAALRGKRIAAIFQDHTASLDPLMSVGAQIEETCLALDTRLSRHQARARSIDLLSRVGIPEPERRYGNYPHQFSGGKGSASSSPSPLQAPPTSSLPTSRRRRSMRACRSRCSNSSETSWTRPVCPSS